MTLIEELRSKKSRDNRDLLDRAADRIEELEKQLPSALTNEEKVSENGKLLLINQNKSNNFDVKSNNELFKQALVEGVNRRIDKTVEIEVITYEQDRLNHFIDLMEKAQKQYDRLYKRYKDSPYLFEGTTLLSDAGRELQFYKDVIAMLEQGNRKQSEWISVKDRLPETKAKQITICDQDIRSGEVTSKVVVEAQVSNTVVVVSKRYLDGKFEQFLDLDNTVDGQWANNECVTHWMPLPEAPKMIRKEDEGK